MIFFLYVYDLITVENEIYKCIFLLSIVLLSWLPCLPFWGSSDCLPFPGDIIYRQGHTLSFACWALMKTSLDQNMLAFFIDLATTIKLFNIYIPSSSCLYCHLYLTLYSFAQHNSALHPVMPILSLLSSLLSLFLLFASSNNSLSLSLFTASAIANLQRLVS